MESMSISFGDPSAQQTYAQEYAEFLLEFQHVMVATKAIMLNRVSMSRSRRRPLRLPIWLTTILKFSLSKIDTRRISRPLSWHDLRSMNVARCPWRAAGGPACPFPFHDQVEMYLNRPLDTKAPVPGPSHF